MLVSGALSLPPKGRRFQRLPAVPRESGALFRKNERLSREGSKKRTQCGCIPRLFSVKLQKKYEKMQQSRCFHTFCGSKVSKCRKIRGFLSL